MNKKNPKVTMFSPILLGPTPCIPLCHHYLFSSPPTCIITAIATPPLMPPLPMLLTPLLPHCHHHTTITGPHGVSLWKSISRGWPSFVGHLLFVTSNLRLGLGLLLDFGRIFGVGTLLCVCSIQDFFL